MIGRPNQEGQGKIIVKEESIFLLYISLRGTNRGGEGGREEEYLRMHLNVVEKYDSLPFGLDRSLSFCFVYYWGGN